MAAPNPLHQACGDGDLALVRGLLEVTPVNLTDPLGQTPLCYASREGRAVSDALLFSCLRFPDPAEA